MEENFQLLYSSDGNGAGTGGKDLPVLPYGGWKLFDDDYLHDAQKSFAMCKILSAFLIVVILAGGSRQNESGGVQEDGSKVKSDNSRLSQKCSGVHETF